MGPVPLEARWKSVSKYVHEVFRNVRAIWCRDPKYGRNSGNFIKIVFQTCSYCHHWVWNPGNVIFSITYIIARLRKNPENKKCKILDKRCFRVQRHHPIRQISPTRPENVSKYKGLCIDFRSILWLSDVSARWSTVCQEFYIFYFRFFSWAELWYAWC